jgi:hypothetical protein
MGEMLDSLALDHITNLTKMLINPASKKTEIINQKIEAIEHIEEKPIISEETLLPPH